MSAGKIEVLPSDAYDLQRKRMGCPRPRPRFIGREVIATFQRNTVAGAQPYPCCEGPRTPLAKPVPPVPATVPELELPSPVTRTPRVAYPPPVHRALQTLLLVLLPACATAPAATPAPSSSAPPLPTARHGQPLPTDAVPSISVASSNILLDGHVVGDTASILREGRPQRIDALFTSLAQSRESWSTAHPGAPFPGIDLLSFPATTPALVVKSVFQTAAFAGYPNEKLAARAADGSTVCLDVDAVVPGLAGAADVGRDELDVVVGAARLVLAWRTNGNVVSTVDVASLDDLPARVQSEWHTHGAHHDRSDHAFDQAVLFVDDTVDYGRIVAVVDAIRATTRDAPSTGEMPALNVTLSMAKEPQADGEHVDKGRLAPEVIQRVVRAHFDAFRQCYKAGVRRRNATLEGIVTVHFVIDRTGAVTEARDDGSTLLDVETVQCVVRGFNKLTFPAPDGGPLTVVYPIQFNPWE
jgi:hypothetical protein